MSPAKRKGAKCPAPGCRKPVQKGGFCEPHYQRDHHRRQKEATISFRPPPDLKAEFFAAVPETERTEALCSLMRQFLDGLR